MGVMDFLKRLKHVVDEPCSFECPLKAHQFLEIVLKALGGRVETCEERQRSHRLVVQLGHKTLDRKETAEVWAQDLSTVSDELLIDMVGQVYMSSPEAKSVCEKELDDWITKNEIGWFVALCGSDKAVRLDWDEEDRPAELWQGLIELCEEYNKENLSRKQFLEGMFYLFDHWDLSDEATGAFAMMVGENYGPLKTNDYHILKSSGSCYYPLCVLGDSRKSANQERERLDEEMLEEMKRIKNTRESTAAASQ